MNAIRKSIVKKKRKKLLKKFPNIKDPDDKKQTIFILKKKPLERNRLELQFLQKIF